MADWRDTLVPASFRGVRFEAPAASEKLGRAVALHDYPQGDWFPEDTGAIPHTHRFTGFLIGDDYLEQRKELVKAFGVKGPGILVHPWLGTLTVQIGNVDGNFSADQGNTWGFSAEYTEFIEERGPTLSVDTSAAIGEAVAALEEAALADVVESTAFDDFLAFLGDAYLGQAFAFLAEFGDSLSRHRETVIDDLAELLSGEIGGESVEELSQSFITVFGAFEVLEIWLDLTLGVFADRPPVTGTTANERQNAANLEAGRAFELRISLAYLVRSIGDTEFEALDDAIALRDLAVDRLNAEIEHATSTDVFNALADLRTLVVRDVDARASDLAELRIQDVTVPRSSLELAWSRYGDPFREAEIVERNAIQHPAFIAGEISVLSE